MKSRMHNDFAGREPTVGEAQHAGSGANSIGTGPAQEALALLLAKTAITSAREWLDRYAQTTCDPPIGIPEAADLLEEAESWFRLGDCP